VEHKVPHDYASLNLDTSGAHKEQNTQHKPCESQASPLSASNRKSGLRSNGRSSGGNGSEVQEVVERLGLTKDGEVLGPKKEYILRVVGGYWIMSYDVWTVNVGSYRVDEPWRQNFNINGVFSIKCFVYEGFQRYSFIVQASVRHLVITNENFFSSIFFRPLWSGLGF
jgi:hypothetical protein